MEDRGKASNPQIFIGIISYLQSLWDGAKLTDNNGYKATFKNVILIMTSNLGTKEANVMGFTKDETSRSDNALKDFFSPEFRNRLSSVVEFNHLTLDMVIKIVDIEIEKLNRQMKSKSIYIELDDEAKEFIAKSGYSREYGAREIARVIDQEVKEPLTDEILFGRLSKGGFVEFTLGEEKLNFGINI